MAAAELAKPQPHGSPCCGRSAGRGFTGALGECPLGKVPLPLPAALGTSCTNTCCIKLYTRPSQGLFLRVGLCSPRHPPVAGVCIMPAMLVHSRTAEPSCDIHTTPWPRCGFKSRGCGRVPALCLQGCCCPAGSQGWCCPQGLSSPPRCRDAEIKRPRPPWRAVSVTGSRQTCCRIRILNDFSSFSSLPVFFFSCPRICPLSRKSLFISDKAMGHAVIVGLLSKIYRSAGSAPRRQSPSSGHCPAGSTHSRATANTHGAQLVTEPTGQN